MTFMWWIIIILFFALSFIGIIMPALPGVPFIWISFFIYHFAIESITSWNFWIAMLILSLFILGADFFISSHWVRRWGGSKAGSFGSVIGLILGPLLLGPIGIIIGPFVFVTAFETLRGVQIDKAARMGLASLIGLIGSSVVKAVLQIIMIIFFFIYI